MTARRQAARSRASLAISVASCPAVASPPPRPAGWHWQGSGIIATTARRRRGVTEPRDAINVGPTRHARDKQRCISASPAAAYRAAVTYARRSEAAHTIHAELTNTPSEEQPGKRRAASGAAAQTRTVPGGNRPSPRRAATPRHQYYFTHEGGHPHRERRGRTVNRGAGGGSSPPPAAALRSLRRTHRSPQETSRKL